jgi:hypothetical protein
MWPVDHAALSSVLSSSHTQKGTAGLTLFHLYVLRRGHDRGRIARFRGLDFRRHAQTCHDCVIVFPDGSDLSPLLPTSRSSAESGSGLGMHPSVCHFGCASMESARLITKWLISMWDMLFRLTSTISSSLCVVAIRVSSSWEFGVR